MFTILGGPPWKRTWSRQCFFLEMPEEDYRDSWVRNEKSDDYLFTDKGDRETIITLRTKNPRRFSIPGKRPLLNPAYRTKYITPHVGRKTWDFPC
jgi:hypothetical protein